MSNASEVAYPRRTIRLTIDGPNGKRIGGTVSYFGAITEEMLRDEVMELIEAVLEDERAPELGIVKDPQP